MQMLMELQVTRMNKIIEGQKPRPAPRGKELSNLEKVAQLTIFGHVKTRLVENRVSFKESQLDAKIRENYDGNNENFCHGRLVHRTLPILRGDNSSQNYPEKIPEKGLQ